MDGLEPRWDRAARYLILVPRSLLRAPLQESHVLVFVGLRTVPYTQLLFKCKIWLLYIHTLDCPRGKMDVFSIYVLSNNTSPAAL